MNKIKLLYLINDLGVGGAEKGMARIVNNLDRKKYDISIIALKKGTGRVIKEISCPIQVVNLNLIKLYKLFKKTQPDILWCSLFYATIIGRVVGRLARVPIIINWEHSERFNGWHRALLNRLTSRLSDIIIADSQKVAEVLHKQLKLNKNKIQVIPIAGINFDNYDAVRHCQKPKHVVGSVGSLREPKGYVYLIEAVTQVIKKHPKTKFIIAGDGPDKEKLEHQIKKKHLTRNFFFLGYQANIPKFLSQLDIYVQPSVWEGLCITVVEAMAAGLPIIASDVGGISDSVINNKNGYLVESKKPEILAEKIIYLIKHSQLRKKMGVKSRKIAESKYSLEIMSEKIDKLICNTLIPD